MTDRARSAVVSVTPSEPKLQPGDFCVYDPARDEDQVLRGAEVGILEEAPDRAWYVELRDTEYQSAGGFTVKRSELVAFVALPPSLYRLYLRNERIYYREHPMSLVLMYEPRTPLKPSAP
jgi:hypothetical protein